MVEPARRALDSRNSLVGPVFFLVTQRIELSPHCSLTPAGALVFFLGLCGACLGIATIMAMRGFWPVLPFAGAEMALVGWALHASMERRHYRQTITIDDADIHIHTHDRRHDAEVVFPRHWARVKLRRPFSRLHPSRLTIGSHGRELEIGSFLTEAQRRGLARRLASLLA
jgi:uncharacterized membrane protein